MASFPAKNHGDFMHRKILKTNSMMRYQDLRKPNFRAKNPASGILRFPATLRYPNCQSLITAPLQNCAFGRYRHLSRNSGWNRKSEDIACNQQFVLGKRLTVKATERFSGERPVLLRSRCLRLTSHSAIPEACSQAGRGISIWKQVVALRRCIDKIRHL